MPAKCYTRQRNDGSNYTTCNDDITENKKPKKKAPVKKPDPVHTLAKPRRIGAVARPKSTKRPGAQHVGTGGAKMGAVYKKPAPKKPAPKKPAPKKQTAVSKNVNNFSFNIDTGEDGESEDIEKTTLNEFIKKVSDKLKERIKSLQKKIDYFKSKGRPDKRRMEWIIIAKEQLKKGISPADIKALEQRVNMSPIRTIYFTNEHRGGAWTGDNIQFGKSLIYVVEAGGKINNRKYKLVNFEF